MRLIFVRHGEPDYEKDTLTENGNDQAKKTAERLKNEGISAIYSSPMGRAYKTASYTADIYGLDITKLDFMHEINWGVKDGASPDSIPYNGHPWSLAFRLYAEDEEAASSDKWREHPYFRDNICLDYYDMISSKFDEFLMSLGYIRKGNTYQSTKSNDDTIAVFAHGGSGGVMLSHVLSLPFPYVMSVIPYGVCSITIIDFEAQYGDLVIPRIELFNDMNHLGNVRHEKLHFDK